MITMLSFNDDGQDDFKQGPHHSTPIKVYDNPQQQQKQVIIWDSEAGSDASRGNSSDDLALRMNSSVEMSLEGRSQWPQDFKSHYALQAEPRSYSVPHGMVARLNACNHSKEENAVVAATAFRMADLKQTSAAHIEQDVINKQRHEIHLLMEELGTRDRELNDLVRSHQSQVKAWETDRERLSELQIRLHQYEEELEKNDHQLKQTVSEMTRVCEQKEHDASDLKRTKEEMEKLAEKIGENSRYIQGIEVENKSLTDSVRELIALRHKMEAREREMDTMLKEKERELAAQESRMAEMAEDMKYYKCRVEETEEKLSNFNTESAAWKKKYCMARDEADRLQADCSNKDEVVSKMTQQLHESLQQAIALQKALFTSCEREKCKEEVLYSMRKQQKRTMQELASLRQLYDRQNKDLTLYHLSVQEKENWRIQERDRERCRSLEKTPSSTGNKEEEDKNMSHRFRSQSELKFPVSGSSFLLKEVKRKPSSSPPATESAECDESDGKAIVTDSSRREGCASTLEVSRKSSGPESRSRARRRPHRVKSCNAATSTSDMTDGSQCDCDSSQRSRSKSISPELTTNMNAKTTLSPKSQSTHSTLVEDRSRTTSNNSCKHSEGPSQTSPSQHLEGRRSSLSPMGSQQSSPRSSQSKRMMSDDVDRWKKRRQEKVKKRLESRGMLDDSSEMSQLSSPERRLDDDFAPADSDGMCPELKRDLGSLGGNKHTACSDLFKKSAIAARKHFLSKMPASLEPSSNRSSFLRKETVASLASSGADDETTPPAQAVVKLVQKDTKSPIREFCAKASSCSGEDENGKSLEDGWVDGVIRFTRVSNDFGAEARSIGARHVKGNGQTVIVLQAGEAQETVQEIPSECHVGCDSIDRVWRATREECERPREEKKSAASTPGNNQSGNSENLGKSRLQSGSKPKVTFKNDDPNKPFSSSERGRSVVSDHSESEEWSACRTTLGDGLNNNQGQPSERTSAHGQVEKVCITNSVANKGQLPNSVDDYLAQTKSSVPEVYFSSRPGQRISNSIHTDENTSNRGHRKQQSREGDPEVSSQRGGPALKNSSLSLLKEKTKCLRFNDTEGELVRERNSPSLSCSPASSCSNGSNSRSRRAKSSSETPVGDKAELTPQQVSSKEQQKHHRPVHRDRGADIVSSSVGLQGPDSEDSTNEDLSSRGKGSWSSSNKSSVVESSIKQRPYFYVEASSSDTKSSRDKNRSAKESSERSNKERFGRVSDLTMKEKPFCSVRGPSLYQQLSKIHYCEKTRRYEWTAPADQKPDAQDSGREENKSNNCSGECSVSLRDDEPTTVSRDDLVSVRHSLAEVTNVKEHCSNEFDVVEGSVLKFNTNSSKKYQDMPSVSPVAPTLSHKSAHDSVSSTVPGPTQLLMDAEDDVWHSCDSAIESRMVDDIMNVCDASDFLEKPSFLSPVAGAVSGGEHKHHSAKHLGALEPVVKRLDFSATFDEEEESCSVQNPVKLSKQSDKLSPLDSQGKLFHELGELSSVDRTMRLSNGLDKLSALGTPEKFSEEQNDLSFKEGPVKRFSEPNKSPSVEGPVKLPSQTGNISSQHVSGKLCQCPDVLPCVHSGCELEPVRDTASPDMMIPMSVGEAEAQLCDHISTPIDGVAVKMVNGESNLSQKIEDTPLDVPSHINGQLQHASVRKFHEDVSEVSVVEDFQDIGLNCDVLTKEKAASVLERSELIQAQTLKLLQFTSTEFMSFDIPEQDLLSGKEVRTPSGKESPHHSKSHELGETSLTGKWSSAGSSDVHERSDGEVMVDQFEERLSSFLEEPSEEDQSPHFPMSPATKLHRLLLESQEMILCLERSSAVPKSLRSKTSVSSHC
ncbi:uncharacterized protein LOC101846771 isoform X2 [Aplysia californica]|uniref:Uncharacterized protein LOC101846771 isoform X2 n=1 Tax=Aplysia californica TaxID=6500 RepID=A0ABM0K579_APLCA|nr:uncharacterized protein LOC101846771 isoform X2 [Aplysia californica]